MRQIVISDAFLPLFQGKDWDYFVAYGGRGSGKSFHVAVFLITEALRTRKLILCCREIQRSIEASVKRELTDMIDRLSVAEYFQVIQTGIRCTLTGSEFIFAGLHDRPEKVRSTVGVDYCWVEEASDVSQHSWDVLVPTIRKPGSKIIVTFNPTLDDDVVYATFVAGEPPPRSIVRKVNYYANPFISMRSLRDARHMSATDHERYLHVWGGQLRTISDAQIYRNYAKVEGEGLEIPEDCEPLYGIDWGFSQDPFAMVELYRWEVENDLPMLYITRDCSALEIGFSSQVDYIDEMMPDAREHLIVADASRPKEIDHLRDEGFNIIPSSSRGASDRSKGSIEDGIDFVKGHRIVVHSRCKNVLWEFKRYSYKIDKQTGVVLRQPVDKDNHICDAIRYALQPVQRLIGRGDWRAAYRGRTLTGLHDNATRGGGGGVAPLVLDRFG